MYKIYKQFIAYGENILSQNSLNRYSLYAFLRWFHWLFCEFVEVYYSKYLNYSMKKYLSYILFFGLLESDSYL